MMRVIPASEPPSFDSSVRQPGLRALRSLAAREFGGAMDAVPAGRFPPCWRESLGDLLEACQPVPLCCCGTGAPSVDRVVAKSTAWDQAYEWRNYRLACSLMNARKGQVASVLDPFEVGNGWFVLELVAFQVLPDPGLPDPTATRVNETIDRLRLNDEECCGARAEYAQEYWCANITIDYVRRHAPFVESELRRQNRLNATDRHLC